MELHVHWMYAKGLNGILHNGLGVFLAFTGSGWLHSESVCVIAFSEIQNNIFHHNLATTLYLHDLGRDKSIMFRSRHVRTRRSVLIFTPLRMVRSAPRFGKVLDNLFLKGGPS